jgi:exonuclease SbcD
MKVLFSSDWHLGYELGGANRADRLPDQLRQIGRIGAYVLEHEVDVLAIAGDVFEAQDRARARAAVGQMLDVLREPLRRGLQVVAIAGNHDRDYFMETANLWLDAALPAETDARLVLRTRPELLTVQAGKEQVSFLLAPFPTASRYDVDVDPSRGAATRNEQMARFYVERLAALQKEAAALRRPTVLISHLTVEGTEVGPHRIEPRDDVVIPRAAFPEFEMTVIGHIHKPQQFGSAHFYYVGALDRMDIGEAGYEPRVLLADIGPKGVRDVQSLPLDPTPFADVVASSEAELRAARDRLERPEETLVRLRLEVAYGTYTAPLIDAARILFPRLYGDVKHEWQGRPVVEPAVQGLNPGEVGATVRRYLEEQVKDETERAALLALVDELMEAAPTP